MELAELLQKLTTYQILKGALLAAHALGLGEYLINLQALLDEVNKKINEILLDIGLRDTNIV